MTDFCTQPGTGKTTIAKHVHALLIQLGLRTELDNYVQVDNGQKLVRGGVDKLVELINGPKQQQPAQAQAAQQQQSRQPPQKGPKKAINGTLFIDEAYQLVGPGSFGGQPVLDELLTVAENQRHEISIILSGYKKEMEDMINGGNIGLASRFTRHWLFEDFDQPILRKLLLRFIKSQKLSVRQGDEVAVDALAHRVARGCGKPGFANARTMRTQWGLVVQRMAARMEKETRERPDRQPDALLQFSDLLGAPPSPEADPALQKLNAMIGLSSAKNQLRKIGVQLLENYNEERLGKTPKPFSLNCIFAGNAGTGKTTAAQLFSEFLVSCGMASGITMITPAKFMAETAGSTRNALREILNSAALSGRVLFIDEAHTMFDVDDRGGGGGVPPLKEASKAAFETLVASIPGDGTSSFILILAGYTDLLRDMLAHPRVDQGLQRRVPQWVDFDDFSNEELRIILKQTAGGAPFNLLIDFETADAVVVGKLAKLRARRGWGNAGTVRNLVVEAAGKLQARVAKLEATGDDRRRLDACDFDVDARRSQEDSDSAVARAMQGLTNAEALTAQLQVIADAAAAEPKKKGEAKDSYLFVGPPGTGKTTVARRLAVLLNDLGALESDHLHEVQGLSLLGSYLGQTKDKVRAAFEAAKGGLLFIDEAYTLYPNDIYKKEAVDAIVGFMTQAPYVGNMAIVLAGYKDELDALLNSPSVNPGIRRRFAKRVQFEAWDLEASLSFITSQLQLKRKHLQPDVAETLRELVSEFIERNSKTKRWGSAGDCINICDAVSGMAEARLREFKRASRQLKKAAPAEGLEDMLEAEEAAMYCTGEDGQPLLLITREDVMATKPGLLPPETAAQPATMTVAITGNVATDSDVAAAPTPPKPPVEAPAEEPKPKPEPAAAPAEAEEAGDDVVQAEKVLIAAKELCSGDLAAMDALLSSGHAGVLLAKLGLADSAETRAALQRHRAEALAKLRAAQEAKAKAEKELADAIAAAEAAQRAKDAAAAAAAAAALAAARREQAALAKLREMGVCEAGFQWIKVGGGYRCAGGSHYVPNSALGL